MGVVPTSDNPELEAYKAHVRKRLAALLPIFGYASVGDFTQEVTMPDEEDEFIELYAGIEVMLGVIRKQLAQYEDLNRSLEEKVMEKEQALAAHAKVLEQTVTERTGALQSKVSEMAEQYAQDEAILESIGEGLIVTDPEGIITVMNHAAQELLGYTDTQAIGKLLTLLVYMENARGHRLPIERRPITLSLKTGRKIVTNDYFFVTPSGRKFPVATTTTPVLLRDHITGSIVVFRDITHEKEVDRAKSEFVSLASHQLRTPLTIIKWYGARLMSQLSKLPQPSQEDIMKVYHTNERMIELVNAILDVSRIDTGTLIVEPQDVDLRAVITTVVTELEPSFQEKQIQITTQFDDDIPEIKLDPRLISIIFFNLVSNAIKYTPRGGAVRVNVTLQPEGVLVSVVDNGYGMSPAEQERLFRKFFRGDTARHIDPDGNGLGLYIAKSVVTLAGGRIWVESQEGKGSTFYVILPTAGMQAQPGMTRLTKHL